MKIGMAGNGRSGRWYVEVEEEIETERHALLIQHPVSGDQIKFPLADAKQDLLDLIQALTQAKDDLTASNT